MKKTGLKTFVCSFVFSLFIMLLINGAFFHAQRPSTSELKIPKQSIALFFRDEPKLAASAQVKPIKEIALSLPIPLIHDKIYAEKEKVAPLSIATNDLIPESIKPKLQETGEIPLEITVQDAFVLAARETIPDAKPHPLKLQENKEIAQSKEAPRKEISDITESDNDSGGDYDSGNEDYTIEENEQSHQPKELVLAQADLKPKISNANLAVTPKETPRKAISDITESDNNSGGDYDSGDEDYSTEEPQDLLIPLQRDYANANSQHEIQIKKTADENQIAMIKGNAPIGSMVSKESSASISEDQKSQDKKASEWESMSQKTESDNPWIAAKGTKYPKNNTVLGEDYYKDMDAPEVKAALSGNKNYANAPKQEIQLASDMVKNILIPIPEDILNDEDLTPQLESSSKSNPKEPLIAEHEKEKKEAAQDLKQEIDKNEIEASKEGSKGGLLKSITSIFSSSPAATTEIGSVEKEEKGLNRYVQPFASKILRAKGATPNKILPAEMRLSFQPNRAEISGTTLKWIQAFANKVNSDNSVILEIRIDGASSFALQQKRLNLLHNILTNKGVDYSKINTVFTTREPNSFIIRTVRVNSNNDKDTKEDINSATNYQPW